MNVDGFSCRYSNKYTTADDTCDASGTTATLHHYDEAVDEFDRVKDDYRNSERLTERELRLKCDMFVQGDEEAVNFFVNADHEVRSVFSSI